jgi:ThiF family
MSTLEQLHRTILLCRDYVTDDLSDNEICRRFQSLHVLCVADARNLSTHSGQVCLTTLVALLSRMGMQVNLAIPEVSLISRQAPFAGTALREALFASSDELITDAAVRPHDGKKNSDIRFVIGDSQAEISGVPSWRLNGEDWYGAIGQLTNVPGGPWTARWAVGSMVSAALAAGEAFKLAIRRMPLRNQEDLIFFAPSPTCKWDFGSVAIPGGVLDVGEVDIVSAGAISQAALFALMRLPNLRMTGRVFDDDTTAASNLNRNMLSTIGDVGKEKVSVVAERCSPSFALTPIPRRFASGAPEAQQMAPLVLVGVDDIPSRWQAQRCTSGTLIVSGTSHFSISSSCHRPNDACCGCQHPLDEVGRPNTIPTVAFVSFWAGLAMAVRLIRHTLGLPYALDRQHLWLTPLRTDQPYATLWSPVQPRIDCPVRCERSRRETRDALGVGVRTQFLKPELEFGSHF